MITFSVETITPKKAAEYLKQNVDNYRKLSRSTVQSYVEDMKNGRWQLNGEAICFGEDGKLKNGQHRLSAIVLAGVPVEMAVVRGVANDVSMYDMGSKRTTTQIATASGIECNATVTAAANILANRFTTGPRGRTGCLAYLRDHIDELNRAYRIVSYGKGNVTKNASCVAAAYLMLQNRILPSYEVELFFRLMSEPLTTSAEGYEVTAVDVCRRMTEERATRSGYQIQKERLEILVLGMRDFHEGKRREKAYKITEPFYYTELMDQLAKEGR